MRPERPPPPCSPAPPGAHPSVALARARRILADLGLTRLHKTVIHRNTPGKNALLRRVYHLVAIRPVTFRPGVDPS